MVSLSTHMCFQFQYCFYFYLVSPLGSVAVTPQVEDGFHGFNYSTLCSASGGLNNEFSWTYLRTGDTLVADASLDLLDVSVLQAGDYRCTVSNQAGSDSAIYTLNSKNSTILTCTYTYLVLSLFTIPDYCTI